MSISLVSEFAPQGRAIGPSSRSDDLQDVLRLARQLAARVSMPMQDEQSHGVRLRLVRAQVLSVVDLLTDLTSDRPRQG